MCELIVSISAICVLLSCYFGRILPWGRNCAVYKAFRNDPTTVGRRDAVRSAAAPVEEGDVLVAIEAMKMKTVIRAERSGRRQTGG